MLGTSLEHLRCPACLSILTDSEGDLRCNTCERSFAIADGIAQLAHPERLAPSDAEVQGKYDAGAEEYDIGLDWLFKAFHEDEDVVRSRMIDLLDVGPGDRVLETGCGTGRDSLRIVERIAPDGEMYVQDLSIGMLRVAQRRLADAPVPVEFVFSNASYLPFAEGIFDAAFHFGGINTFDELERAINELTRVVRIGGKVVIGDEGIAPWQRERPIGRILVNANPLYAHRPPLELLPETALDTRLHWILGNAFYVIEYRVGAAPPAIDLDLPIPGPRGGTLRSRYEQR
jgi:ubiquinone/menaquinone biosynthesis C-methylase UbiE